MERWPGLELRHLAALAAIDDEQSFRGAADQLGYVQSAVSQQISGLERVVGSRLVERARGRARVTLTPEGELLVRYAHTVLAQLDSACADLRAFERGSAAPVRVGLSQSMAAVLLPGMLSRLAGAGEGNGATVAEVSEDSELFVLLDRGDLEVAITELPVAQHVFAHRKLVVDPTVLVSRVDLAPTHRGLRPTLAQISEMNLIHNTSWRMYSLLETELEAQGVAGRERLASTTDAGVLALVAAGLGVALMPMLSVPVPDAAVRVVALDGLLPPRTIVACWQRGRQLTATAAAAVDAAGAVCREQLAVQARRREIESVTAAPGAALVA